MIDLKPADLDIVLRILAEHVPTCEVRAFGSRAIWTAKDYSDLDLVIIDEEPVPLQKIGRLREAFEDSNLPICVDILDWHTISDTWKEKIEYSYAVLQKRAPGNEWDEATFGDCALLVKNSVSPADFGEVPYVGLEHIGQETLSLVGSGVASDVTSTKSRFKVGDVLFGKLRPYFRKVIQAKFDGICSTDIWVVRPAEGVDARFLFYLMASRSFVDLATQGTEGTRMPRAKWDFVSRLLIRLPPIDEQRRIAQVLGALDDRIELNRCMSETLEEMARALFQSWFVNFDPVHAKAEGRPSGLPPELDALFPDTLQDSELGPIPKGWQIQELGDVAESIRGRSYRSVELSESETALVTLKSFARGGGYRSDGLKAYTGPYKPDQIVLPGEMVIACTDVTQAAEVVGRPAIVARSSCYSTLVASLDAAIVRPHRNFGVSVEFLYCLCSGFSFAHHTYAYVSGTTVLHLSKDAIPSFKFVMPPQEICRYFDALAVPAIACSLQGASWSDALSAQRDALLPKLVSGELRVPACEKTV